MIFDFGYRLRALRESKNLTQAQVARRLNLSKTTISGYENNVKTPSLDVLMQLSILYGVSSDYILGLEDRDMLLIDGLTDRQQEILRILLTEFRTSNQLRNINLSLVP
ncbi:helix-turn-helix domain-containing protein [Zongyangia hominis]|uniref:Helix-turn-helix transcriptional regulator n=1 Tax=Zongyangia hominis TaxID=2763677 RepID=A0A926EBC5_9FIRM|nr:helix-turn-helix transcriptional regulator [Zongyangia hominis]MBC8570757.1 helix-turn-helix transcriptional regulator [Zongyangia hominis]